MYQSVVSLCVLKPRPKHLRSSGCKKELEHILRSLRHLQPMEVDRFFVEPCGRLPHVANLLLADLENHSSLTFAQRMVLCRSNLQMPNLYPKNWRSDCWQRSMLSLTLVATECLFWKVHEKLDIQNSNKFFSSFSATVCVAVAWRIQTWIKAYNDANSCAKFTLNHVCVYINDYWYSKWMDAINALSLPSWWWLWLPLRKVTSRFNMHIGSRIFSHSFVLFLQNFLLSFPFLSLVALSSLFTGLQLICSNRDDR